MKNYSKSELYFLSILLLCTSVLLLYVFKPFLSIGILALVGATVFYPVYTKLLRFTQNKKSFSAILATLFVVCIVATPLIFFVVQMVREATSLYASLATGGLTTVSLYLTRVAQTSGKALLGFSPQSFNVDAYIKSGLDFLIQNVGVVFSNVLALLGGGVLFFVALYYFFKRGDVVLQTISAMSPLRKTYNESIVTQMRLWIISIVQGSLFVAVLQGVFTGIGFLVFGVPSALLWGGIAMFVALIPGIGTSLVVLPAVLYLYLAGYPLHSLGLLAYGVTSVSLIDNVLKPTLMQKGIHIHPLFILLSALGGIFFFGPIGFLLGPLILGFLSILLELYASTRTVFGIDA